MIILNLGCGTKTSPQKNVINIDWSIYLRIKSNPILRIFAKMILRDARLTKLESLPDNILVYDLSKGIPFATDSVDAVYHSHLLEHFDRDVAEKFLYEVKRVLKKGGVQRIVVPDMERLCKKYLEHISICEIDPSECAGHELYIAKIIEQCVRKEAYGTSKQGPLQRWIENILLGDARKRGETHQCMYDKISLSTLLSKIGFRKVVIQDYKTSLIPDWNDYKLDVNDEGNEYKPDSLYIEAVK